MFTLSWLTILGGAIGSFLNVVIYRLPAGESLIHPGSRCPRCQHALSARDNIPVLGWFLLRGRCRYCQQSISFRYPLNEAIVGGIFLLMAWRWLLPHDLYQGESFLPQFPVAAWVRWGYVTGLCCGLFTFAWMEHDGHDPCWQVLAVLFLGSTVVMFVMPEAVPSEAVPPWGVVLAVVLTAMVFLGQVAGGLTMKEAIHDRGTRHASACLVLVGWFLGWPCLVAVTVVGMIMKILSAAISISTQPNIRAFGWSASLTTAIAAFLCWLPDSSPGDLEMSAGWAGFPVLALFLAFIASLLTCLVSRRQS